MSLPQFSTINPDTLVNQLDTLLCDNKAAIDNILNETQPTWDNTLLPLMDLDNKLSLFWSPISHLNSVQHTPALRDAYNACLPKLTAYATTLAHDPRRYKALLTISTQTNLNSAQKELLRQSLRDLKLSGIDLNSADKKTYAKLTEALAKLTTSYEEHILDATQDFEHIIADEAQLKGLPDTAIAMAKQSAEQKKLTGYRFTLDFPSYYPVMLHASNRALRKTLYHAYTTRASELGPSAGQFDNTSVITDILETRLRLANLLGFSTFSDYSLATKMLTQVDEVKNFLNHLATKAKPVAQKEYQHLLEFAEKTDGLVALEPWDVPYYSEKLRQAHYDLSQEDLRPYFAADAVLAGLFDLIHKLFKLKFSRIEADVWQKDVQAYVLLNAQDEPIAYCYCDLYAREGKRGGAWMDDAANRFVLGEHTQLPIAFVTGNMNPPINNDPALLTHSDVVTLFHEFGHALQHLFTQQDYPDIAGINGIPWDAVEVASQFLENYAWEKTVLDSFARHYQTGEPLPNALFNKMKAAKQFHAGMHLMRQLEFALFDITLHQAFDSATPNQVATVLNSVRDQVSVTPIADFNRFQHSFSHIFAGGYAAGYYSYLWAEVMALDAFSLFKENGIYHADTAKAWRECLLETGGSETPDVLFKRFRGRAPDVNALLSAYGVNQTPETI